MRTATKRMCSQCITLKSSESFGRHKNGKDGLRRECKECSVRLSREYRATEVGREKLIEYRESEKGRDVAYRADKKWKQSVQGKQWLIDNRGKYKEKTSARNKVNHAIKAGKLKRMPCEKCDTNKTEAHHDDYSKPLEVTWLCVACHNIFHNLKQGESQ